MLYQISLSSVETENQERVTERFWVASGWLAAFLVDLYDKQIDDTDGDVSLEVPRDSQGILAHSPGSVSPDEVEEAFEEAGPGKRGELRFVSDGDGDRIDLEVASFDVQTAIKAVTEGRPGHSVDAAGAQSAAIAALKLLDDHWTEAPFELD